MLEPLTFVLTNAAAVHPVPNANMSTQRRKKREAREARRRKTDRREAREDRPIANAPV